MFSFGHPIINMPKYLCSPKIQMHLFYFILHFLAIVQVIVRSERNFISGVKEASIMWVLMMIEKSLLFLQLLNNILKVDFIQNMKTRHF